MSNAPAAPAAPAAERFWTVADGRAREVTLIAEEAINVSYLVRAVDTGAEWVTFTGLYDTRAEALASNGL